MTKSEGSIHMYKVIFHANEEEKINQIYNNIMNLMDDLEENNKDLKIEIVANGQGVGPFRKDDKEYGEKVRDLLNMDVKIAICSNTLKKLDFKEDEFLKEIIFVRSGIGELVKKQAQGWIYIKP